MGKTYGIKSLTFSLLISLGLLILSYLIIRHRMGFLAVAALILGYDVWAYAPRFQMVKIGDGAISFSSINPFRKRVTAQLAFINKVTLQSVNEVYYKVVISTNDGDKLINVNMYPSEFKALTQIMVGTGLITETRRVNS